MIHACFHTSWLQVQLHNDTERMLQGRPYWKIQDQSYVGCVLPAQPSDVKAGLTFYLPIVYFSSIESDWLLTSRGDDTGELNYMTTKGRTIIKRNQRITDKEIVAKSIVANVNGIALSILKRSTWLPALECSYFLGGAE